MVSRKAKKRKARKKKGRIAAELVVAGQKEAAAVAEFLGNKDEAARLRKLAAEKNGQLVDECLKVFNCRGCGAEYSEAPEQCVKCGGSTFVKARKERKEPV